MTAKINTSSIPGKNAAEGTKRYVRCSVHCLIKQLLNRPSIKIILSYYKSSWNFNGEISHFQPLSTFGRNSFVLVHSYIIIVFEGNEISLSVIRTFWRDRMTTAATYRQVFRYRSGLTYTLKNGYF